MLKRFLVFALFLCALAPARAVTINVTYGDSAGEGFFDPTLGAARRTAFEAAASQWSQRLAGTVPINVSASFNNLGGENAQGLAVLGFASPTFLEDDWAGAPQASTRYAVALANQLAGSDLEPGTADIEAQFNDQVDTSSVFGSVGFYYGTDLNAGSDIDFYTVALHEIGHGLGFLGSVDSGGNFLTDSLGHSFPSIWDRQLANGSTSAATTFPSLTTSQRAASLISDALFFSGTNTRAANGNVNAKIYAPNPYESGSSTSHLDETTYSPPPDGTASDTTEELMTPINTADTHTLGPILLGIMRDIGWTLQPTTPAISINDVSVAESAGTASITVRLSSASTQSVTVNYATANGSATAGSDYTATSGTLTFTAGSTTRTFSVPIINDTAIEGDETFVVNLSSPTNATIADAQGIVQILDDDVNSPPVDGSLSPASVTDAPGATRVFTATYSDANGAGDFSYIMIHVNGSTSAVGALRVEYNTVSNKLYLRNDAGTGWLGGFAPGSANVVSNGQGSINCAQTTVTKAGNTITMKWALSAGGAWAGTTQKTYLFSQDNKGAQDGYDQKGTWTISGNVAPVNTSLSPSAVTSPPAEEHALTAIYSDANGQGNISQAILRVGGVTANGFRAFYNPLTNQLWVLNDAGTAYIGGNAPGAAGTISNSHGTVNCALTTVTRSGNTLTVNWRISLKNSDWTGTKQNLSLFCKDRGGLFAGYTTLGTWTLTAPLSRARVEPSH